MPESRLKLKYSLLFWGLLLATILNIPLLSYNENATYFEGPGEAHNMSQFIKLSSRKGRALSVFFTKSKMVAMLCQVTCVCQNQTCLSCLDWSLALKVLFDSDILQLKSAMCGFIVDLTGGGVNFAVSRPAPTADHFPPMLTNPSTHLQVCQRCTSIHVPVVTAQLLGPRLENHSVLHQMT